MTYILYMFAAMAGYNSATFTASTAVFNSKEACQIGATRVVEELNRFSPIPNIHWVCVEKGKK